MARSVFDPEARASNINLPRMVSWLSGDSADSQSSPPPNSSVCLSALRDLAAVWLCGNEENEEWRTLLGLVTNRLGGWIANDAWAKTRSPYNLSVEIAGLALARWFESGERQTDLFDRAHEQRVLYLDELKPSQRTKATAVYDVAVMAIAAERFEAAAEYVRRAMPNKEWDPHKARNAGELALAIAREGPSEALASRFLKGNLGTLLASHGEDRAATALYAASVAGLPGTPKHLLQQAPYRFVSYLKPREAAVARPTKRTETRPRPTTPATSPLPPRIIPSSARFEDRARSIWRETDDGWAAAYQHGISEDHALLQERASDLVELSSPWLDYDPASFPRLRRATPSGRVLSKLADAGREIPLEVAFSAEVPQSTWVDRRRVASPETPELKHWKPALQVGALTSLRAISIAARETDRERIKRGDRPYAIFKRWFARSQLAAQLEAIEAHVSWHNLADSLALLDALPRLKTLALWFPRVSTACFWIERRGQGVHALIQTYDGMVNGTPGTRHVWPFLLEAVLTRDATDRLDSVELSTVQSGVDEEAERTFLSRYATVGDVHIGVPLREL